MSEPRDEGAAGLDPTDVLALATLAKPHGVRGELKLRCATHHVELLRRLADEAEPITLRQPVSGDEFEVTFASVRGHESAPIVAIDGVEDRTSAERFSGAHVCVARALLPPLEEDEYYLADLAGCVVHDGVGGPRIGAVTSAESLPANVVLTVGLDAGGSLLVPLAGDAVPHVDVAGRRIDVDLDFLDARPAPGGSDGAP